MAPFFVCFKTLKLHISILFCIMRIAIRKSHSSRVRCGTWYLTFSEHKFLSVFSQVWQTICSIPQLTKQHVQQGGATLSICGIDHMKKGEPNLSEDITGQAKWGKLNYRREIRNEVKRDYNSICHIMLSCLPVWHFTVFSSLLISLAHS